MAPRRVDQSSACSKEITNEGERDDDEHMAKSSWDMMSATLPFTLTHGRRLRGACDSRELRRGETVWFDLAVAYFRQKSAGQHARLRQKVYLVDSVCSRITSQYRGGKIIATTSYGVGRD